MHRLVAALLLALPLALTPAAAAAHHTLRKSIFDLFGPGAWGLYVILPVPYLLLATFIVVLRRRARRHASEPPHEASR